MVGSGTVMNIFPLWMSLPPAPKTLLQLIKCGCSKSVCDYLSVHGVGAKLNIYIVLTCVAVEQKRTHVILPVVNMLMPFKQLFSFGFRHFFNNINKLPL